jgi:hypothetical protein
MKYCIWANFGHQYRGNIGKRVDSNTTEQEHVPPKQKAKLPIPTTLTKSPSIDHILKKIIPAELSMLENVPYEPRPRHGPIPSQKTQIGAASADKLTAVKNTVSDAPLSRASSTGTTNPVPEIEEGPVPSFPSRTSSVQTALADSFRSTAGTEQQAVLSSATLQDTNTDASRQDGEKETRWADKYGDEKAAAREVVVEITKDMEDEQAEVIV